MSEIIRLDHISMNFYVDPNKISSLKEWVVKTIRHENKYHEFSALKDISFTVERGDVVGLIDRNGAGKSTLLKVISRIYKPSSGTLSVNGCVAPLLELGSGFDMELSGRENIFLNGAILGYSEEYLNRKYTEILAFSELDDFINSPIKTYSSGMLSRLAFSVATVVVPDILIVDEILSVGDASFQKKSSERMMELMSGGTTVLYVSHDLSSIRKLCTRVLWLDNGEIRMQGNAQEVCDAYERWMNC